MSKTIIETCSAPYQKSITLRVSHYDSRIADVQSCVEHLFCKDLGDGTLAAYGFYSVLLLFTCADFSGKRMCFHMLIRQAFSLLFERKASETDAYEVQFVPQITAHPIDSHAIDWLVEIKADAKAIFYAETPDESLKAMIPVTGHPVMDEEKQVSQEEEKSPPISQTQADDTDGLPPESEATDSNTEAPEPRQDAETMEEHEDIAGNYWRILPDTSVPMDELLNMDEVGRRKFMED